MTGDRGSLAGCGIALSVALFIASAEAQITVPGATGADGAFTRNSGNIEIDLSLADDGVWDQGGGGDENGDGTGDGVYDSEKWAVVFKFTSVTIGNNVTVTFKQHPSRAPVVFLVSGSVTLAPNAAINLDGATGVNNAPAESGPGGFRGGHSSNNAGQGSGGFGPGGSPYQAGAHGHGGSYATLGGSCGRPGASGSTYGNAAAFPLLGGSGGASVWNNAGYAPGGGGGAILIAATDAIAIDGSIRANGGVGFGPAGGSSKPGGSGGAIRLIAHTITGTSGILRAVGQGDCVGGNGRIRLEANTISQSIDSNPSAATGYPGASAAVFPPASAPTVRIAQVDTKLIDNDPRASFDFGSQDASICNVNGVTVVLECANVPLNSSVYVRATPTSGSDAIYIATYQSGDLSASIWHATGVVLPNGFSALQARVVLP